MPKTGGSISIPSKLLASGLALAVTVVVCGTAATVVVSSQLATRPEHEVAAPDFATVERETFRDAGPTAQLIDSLLIPLGPLGDAQPGDVELITALYANRSQRAGVWNAATPNAFPAPVPTPADRTLPVRFGLDSLTSEEIAAAAADTASPWLPVFRRWARSRPLPSLWGYRPGLPGIATVSELPSRNFGAMRSLFTTNDIAALVALRAGNTRVAMERARENLAASRHLLEQPSIYDEVVGRHFARRAVQLLARSAERAGDSVVFHQALRVDNAAMHFDNRIVKWLHQQEANPNSGSAVLVAANRKLPPSLRIAAMAPIVAGGCRNTRELVFGFSGARVDALQRAARAVSDIDRSGELVVLYRQQLEQISTHPELHLPDTPASESVELEGLGALEWIVPPGVRARIALCNAWRD